MRGTIDGQKSRLTPGGVLVLILTTLAIVLVSSGCSGSAKISECKATATNPDACLYSQVANNLEAIAGTHYELMKAVGRAYAAGTINDAQKEQARQVGKKLESVLIVARRALATAKAISGPIPWGAFSDVQEALSELTNLSGAF